MYAYSSETTHSSRLDAIARRVARWIQREEADGDRPTWKQIGAKIEDIDDELTRAQYYVVCDLVDVYR